MIEKKFEKELQKFKAKTNKDLLECAIAKWLQSWYFIETEDDLYELFKEQPWDFTSLVMWLSHTYRPSNWNWLSDRRVEMALRVSLENTLMYKDRMKTNETYVSAFIYSVDQLAKALTSFDNQIAQNPLAFLIDPNNLLDYQSIIKWKFLNQVWLEVKNWQNNTRPSRFFLQRWLTFEHLIEDINKQAYHPTVWYLICSGTLLSYSHLFNKVKEYVQKSKALS